jgi:hypothetical protein
MRTMGHVWDDLVPFHIKDQTPSLWFVLSYGYRQNNS